MKGKIELTLLANAVDAVAALVSESSSSVFKVMPEGVACNAMDASSSAMVSFVLSKLVMEDYDAGLAAGETEGKIALNVKKLADILKGFEDKVSFAIDQKNAKLTLADAGLNMSVRLDDPSAVDMDKMKIPQLKFPCKVILPTNELKRAVKSLAKVADAVDIGVTKDLKFFIQAQGEAKVDDGKYVATGAVVTTDDNYTSTFTLDFLETILNTAGKADNVVIELASNYPMRLSYSLKPGMNVTYMLAPRVSAD